MLKKLLKYDLKAVFKYWWIAAVISVAAAVVGGFCSSILNSEKELPPSIVTTAEILLMLVIFSFVAFCLVAMILVFIRFYKNFFTDEGYLTFTLPVRRQDLPNAKVITGGIALTATLVMCVLNCVLIGLISDGDYFFSAEFIHDLQNAIRSMWNELGGYFPVYAVELLVLLVVCVLFTILFLYCCVTFASVIVKKGKLFAAIGIYYGANSIFSFLLQLFLLFGITSLSGWLSALPGELENPLMALVLLGLICFVAMFCGLLYAAQYWMLERKLNLS